MDSVKNKNLIFPVDDNIVIPFIGGAAAGRDSVIGIHNVIDSALSLVYEGEKTVSWLNVLPEGKKFNEETLSLFKNSVVGMTSSAFSADAASADPIHDELVSRLDLYACYQPIYYLNGFNTKIKNPENLNVYLFTGGAEYAHDEVWTEYERIINSAFRFALKKDNPTITFVHNNDISNSMERTFKEWGLEIADTDYADRTFSSNVYKSLCKIWDETIAEEELEKARKAGKIIVNTISMDDFLEDISHHPEKYSVVVSLTCCGEQISARLTEMLGGGGEQVFPRAYYNYNTACVILKSTYEECDEDASGCNMTRYPSDLLSGIMMLEYLGWNEAATYLKRTIKRSCTCRENYLRRHLSWEEKEEFEIKNSSSSYKRFMMNVRHLFPLRKGRIRFL